MRELKTGREAVFVDPDVDAPYCVQGPIIKVFSVYSR